jgi:hypothetical protein
MAVQQRVRQQAARAVKYYGTDIFHALNNLALPRVAQTAAWVFIWRDCWWPQSFDVATRDPALAEGGMVPALAGGGGSKVTATGLTHVRLDFGLGHKTCSISSGIGHVVRKLQGFAVKSGLLSTGRKPGRGK